MKHLVDLRPEGLGAALLKNKALEVGDEGLLHVAQGGESHPFPEVALSPVRFQRDGAFRIFQRLLDLAGLEEGVRPVAGDQVVLLAQFEGLRVLEQAALHIAPLEQLVALIPQLHGLLLFLPVLVCQLADEDGELDVGLFIYRVRVERLVRHPTLLAHAAQIPENALLAN